MTIGWEGDGERQTLRLSYGDADFIHVLRSPDGTPFPSGFTAAITLFATREASRESDAVPLATWTPESATESEVKWRIQSDADGGPLAMIAAGAGWYRLHVFFPAAPDPDGYLWYYGAVRYRG